MPSRQASSAASVLLALLLCPSANARVLDLLDLSLEELMQIEITSGTKSPKAIIDIAGSTTVLTRTDITRQGYATLEELLLSLPGFYHIDNYEDFLIGIRGALGGSIAFLVNGIPQHPTRIKNLSIPDRSRSNIPIAAIDRIEVIRGPASVIYGKNAFAGSINIITNESTQNNVTIATGNNNTTQAFARLNNKNPELPISLNIGKNKNAGISGAFSDMMSPQQLATLDPAMHTGLDGLTQHDDSSIDLSANYKKLQFNFRYSNMHYGFYAVTPSFHDGNQLDLKSWTGSLAYTIDLAKNFTATTTLINSEETYYFEPDFAVPNISGNQKQGSKRTEIEQTLSISTDNGLEILLGLNYRKLYDARNIINLPEINYHVNAQSGDIKSVDIFADTQYSLTNNIDLIAGFRTSNSSAYDIDKTRNPVPTTSTINQQAENSIRLAGQYRLNNQNRIKLIYSSATQDNSSVELEQPEKIYSTELNYLFTAETSNVSLSLFNNDTDHIRRRTIRFNGNNIVQSVDNSGQWRTRGAEIITEYRPSRQFSTGLSITAQHTIDNASNQARTGNSPSLLAQGKIAYKFSTFTAASDLSYVGSMLSDYSTDLNSGNITRLGDKVPAYTLMNISLRYQKNNAPWFISAHVFNLFNHTIRYPANELADFEKGALGRDREFLISTGISF